MFYVGCSVSERFVNPLFEVFDGGDLILSSYRDIEEPFTRVRIYFDDAADSTIAEQALLAALSIVGVETTIERGDIPDEDWKFAYRRHFKTEKIGSRLLTVPEWELPGLSNDENRQCIVLDPGMAFGTGKHETTRACLEFIEESSVNLPSGASFLDMGCGSGILSIAAAKLGFQDVEGFDVDQEAVEASIANADKNGVKVAYKKFALGRPGAEKPLKQYDFVAANILGPLLIRFSGEIAPYAKDKLVISGILTNLYEEVLDSFVKLGFKELSRKELGEWTSGLLSRR